MARSTGAGQPPHCPSPPHSLTGALALGAAPHALLNLAPGRLPCECDPSHQHTTQSPCLVSAYICVVCKNITCNCSPIHYPAPTHLRVRSAPPLHRRRCPAAPRRAQRRAVHYSAVYIPARPRGAKPRHAPRCRPPTRPARWSSVRAAALQPPAARGRRGSCATAGVRGARAPEISGRSRIQPVQKLEIRPVRTSERAE